MTSPGLLRQAPCIAATAPGAYLHPISAGIRGIGGSVGGQRQSMTRCIPTYDPGPQESSLLRERAPTLPGWEGELEAGEEYGRRHPSSWAA